MRVGCVDTRVHEILNCCMPAGLYDLIVKVSVVLLNLYVLFYMYLLYAYIVILFCTKVFCLCVSLAVLTLPVNQNHGP